MSELFQWLSNNPTATNILIFSFGMVITSITLILVISVFQKREISIWQIKIGAGSKEENDKKRDKMTDIRKACNELFLKKYPDDFDDKLTNAKETWIVGINLIRTTTYYTLFEKKLKNGDKMRILLIKPNGTADKVTALRRPETDYTTQNTSLILTSLSSLSGLKKTVSDNLEIKVIDYPLSFGVFAFDPDKSDGVLYMSYYPFKTAGGTIPVIALRKNDGFWYEHFESEIKNIWNNSELWNCDQHT